MEAMTLAEKRQEFEERARACRDRMVPMQHVPAHDLMFKRAGPNGRGFDNTQTRPSRSLRLTGSPAQLDQWAAANNFMLGGTHREDITKSQYKALSRACFSDERMDANLKSLAVEFLRLNKSEYYEQVMRLELGSAAQTGCKTRLDKIKELLTGSDIYDKWCNALDEYHEAGQLHTLEVISLILHVEIRVVASLPVEDPTGAPRVLVYSLDPSGQVGIAQPKCVVYLALEQKHGAEYYRTLEGDPRQAPTVGTMGGVEGSVAGSGAGSVAGSAHTCWTADFDVEGEEVSLIDLMNGVQGDERHTRLIGERNGREMHVDVYKEYIHTGIREFKRTIVLKKKQASANRSSARDAEMPGSQQPVAIPHKDVDMWAALIAEQGPAVAGSLAQHILDAINRYTDHLCLVPDAAGMESGPPGYLDSLGQKMYHLADAAKQIKLQMFESRSTEQQPHKVVVVGVPGAGKTTTINHCSRRLAKSDEKLGVANGPTLTITQKFTKRHAHESPRESVDEALLRSAEDALEAEVTSTASEFNVIYTQLNERGDDIMPTGTGCDITALVANLEFDDRATETELSITYRPGAEVSDVLGAAREIRRQKVVTGGSDVGSEFGDEAALPDLGEERDASLLAHKACAMLNIETNSGNAIEMIEQYEGMLELPVHLQQLLGRTRRVCIAAPTSDEMFQELNKKLVLLTVGSWSNWGIIESISVVIPSETARLTITDLPGLGVDRANPFRTGIVHEALNNCECSSFVMCLKIDRNLEGGNSRTEDIMEEAGVYEQIFQGAGALERRIGKIMTISALDWNKEKRIDQLSKTKKPLPEREARDAGNKIQEQAAAWLRGSLLDALKRKNMPGQLPVHIVPCFTKCFAVDVCGAIEKACGVTDFSLNNVVKV